MKVRPAIWRRTQAVSDLQPGPHPPFRHGFYDELALGSDNLNEKTRLSAAGLENLAHWTSHAFTPWNLEILSTHQLIMGHSLLVDFYFDRL